MESIASLFDLSGKGAIVTGGGSGLGRADALRLAQAGAKVMIADINLDDAKETVAKIETAGGAALAMQADASSAADAQKVVDATVEAFGSLDILINNAGIYPNDLVLKMTEERWDRVLDLNLKGTFFFSQAAAKAMITAGHGGRIVNMASMSSFTPMGAMAHYDSSKGGIVTLTKSLAYELAPHNILVNAVAPGYVLTEATMKRGAATPMDPEVAALVKFRGLDQIALKRLGTEDDIAKAVLFLCSAAADYIDGIVLVVDGGALVQNL